MWSSATACLLLSLLGVTQHTVIAQSTNDIVYKATRIQVRRVEPPKPVATPLLFQKAGDAKGNMIGLDFDVVDGVPLGDTNFTITFGDGNGPARCHLAGKQTKDGSGGVRAFMIYEGTANYLYPCGLLGGIAVVCENPTASCEGKIWYGD